MGYGTSLECDEEVVADIRLENQHVWRPPFGIDRIGRGIRTIVELQSAQKPLREYWLVSFLNGKEVERKVLSLAGIMSGPPYRSEVFLGQAFDQLALFAKCKFQGAEVEVLRCDFQSPDFEADAVAEPVGIINPVDLGAILVPHDYLLVNAEQQTRITIAAISYKRSFLGASIAAWFESQPSSKIFQPCELPQGKRLEQAITLPPTATDHEKDILQVAILDGQDKAIWQKSIPTMRVVEQPELPRFGAQQISLRYDAPISVRDTETGAFSSLDYDQGWDPKLKDVVVSLPNGSRFVFWRGASYIPFWASEHNMGMSYEWAETRPPPDGFVDCVEPLMDKELRYSRVQIVESTSARVHVRWTYQSTDFEYQVWGDRPVEDFYFYPDGFGTRVLNLYSDPSAVYEVQEFIILAPAGAFPYHVINPRTADILFLDGEKIAVRFPAESDANLDGLVKGPIVPEGRDSSAVYRVRLHKDDKETAISFSPESKTGPYIFNPLFDRGEMVTPYYWGSHWPLARGNTTGMAIDDRISLTPSHNSVLTWNFENHTPAFQATVRTLDSLGRSRVMKHRRWYWLIGMTDLSDQQMLDWARSFETPPSMELDGARFDSVPYVPERRATRLVVDQSLVSIRMKPEVRSINPVFELIDAPPKISRITLGDRELSKDEYAWDGRVLWVRAELDSPTLLLIAFH